MKKQRLADTVFWVTCLFPLFSVCFSCSWKVMLRKQHCPTVVWKCVYWRLCSLWFHLLITVRSLFFQSSVSSASANAFTKAFRSVYHQYRTTPAWCIFSKNYWMFKQCLFDRLSGIGFILLLWHGKKVLVYLPSNVQRISSGCVCCMKWES